MCDVRTGKVSTRVNGWQCFSWMSICECINYLVLFFTVRCQIYSFSVKFAFSCVHKCLACLYKCLKKISGTNHNVGYLSCFICWYEIRAYWSCG